jgi:hypothetical protein
MVVHLNVGHCSELNNLPQCENLCEIMLQFILLYRRQMHANFWCENLKTTGRLEGLSIDFMIILKFIFKNRFDVDLILLVQDMEEWRALLHIGMSFHVPEDTEKFLTI